MSDLRHRYRLISSIGLERQMRGIPARNFNQLSTETPCGYPWLAVTGDDFLRMTWEELHHVALTLRAAETSDEAADHSTVEGVE